MNILPDWITHLRVAMPLQYKYTFCLKEFEMLHNMEITFHVDVL